MLLRRSVLAWMAMALLFVGLVGSRVIMPDGPWEQDEAILATGVLDFDITHHRPHPPGFPAWIGMGKLGHWFFGDPLLALRVLSAAFSVITVLMFVDLLRPFVGLPIATVSALLYGFLPGVWAHASRAFSTTPAVGLTVAAVWLWSRGTYRTLIASWIALVLAAFVRPQLAVVLGVLALVGCVERKRPWLEVREAIAIAVFVALGIVAVVVFDARGVRGLWRVFDHHFSSHVDHSRSRRWPSFSDLGIVRALGGPAAAILWIAAVAGGLLTHARINLRWALWCVASMGAGLVTILMLHNPVHPRYAIPVLAMGVPWVALLAARRQSLGLVLSTAALVGSVWTTAPTIWAMHEVPLPPVAALRGWAANASSGQPLVHVHAFFSFVRYEHMSGRLPGPIVDLSRASATTLGRLKKSYALLAGARSSALPGVTVHEAVYDQFPRSAWDLSQRRFERATLLYNPVLIRSGSFPIEENSRDERFAWLGPRVRLLVPAGARILHLVVDVDGKRAPLGLRIVVGDRLVESRTLERGTSSLTIPMTEDGEVAPTPRSVELTLLGARRAEGGSRFLSARLYGAWAEGPELSVAPATFGPGQPHTAMAYGAELSGFFAPERFTVERRLGAWTRGDAWIRFPAAPGTVTITLAQPPPRDPIVQLDTDVSSARVRADGRPRSFSLRVGGAERQSFVRIRSETGVPADRGRSNDRRSLGAIVFELETRPDP